MDGGVDNPFAAIAECKKALKKASTDEKGRIFERMGDAYIDMKKRNKAVICYREALDAGHEDLDFIAKFAQVLLQLGGLEEAEALVQRTLKRDMSDLHKASLYNRLASIARVRMNYEEGKRYCETAIGLLSRPGGRTDQATSKALAEAHNDLGLCLWRQSMFKEAITEIKKALREYTRINDAVGQSDANNNLGNIHYHTGDLDLAELYYRRSVERQERESYYNNIGLIMLARGQFKEAEENLKKSVKISKMQGLNHITHTTHLNLVDLALEMGNLIKAKAWVELAHRDIKGQDHSPKMSYLYYTKARIALMEDHIEEADTFGKEALRISRKESSKGSEAVAHQVIGLAAAAKGDHMTARNHLERSIEIFRQANYAYEHARAVMDYVRYLMANGHMKEARMHAEEAKRTFKRMKLEYELAKMEKLGL
jgi:tetratricopeptide (TPR) repeat protein